ncbi:hypothetical protein [Jiulongibacter sp. NS-SX5]|uniref:hypothetical protein n=1 Tax=Jiulongibacter sp. NS-SX5 TaxID=3463854 RepID=UPI0040582872
MIRKSLPIILIFTLIGNLKVAFSQQYENLILGDWVSIKLVDASGSELKNPQFIFDFKENLKCFSLWKPFDKGKEYKYSISGNKLTINYANYEILEITKNIMKLKLIEENDRIITYSRLYAPSLNSDSIASYQCDTLILNYRKLVYADKTVIIPRSYFIKSDSKVNQLISPQFQSYDRFCDLFVNEIYYSAKTFKVSDTRFLNASFEISENGKVENVLVEEINGDKWLEKQFEKALKSKNNIWQPLQHNNKIRSRIEIPIKVEYEEKIKLNLDH